MSPPSQQLPLRILYLEDNPLDRELVAHTLAAEGLNCKLIYAKGKKDFEAGLHQPNLDLILSDFTVPSYDGMAALATAQQILPEVPFLFISGTIGEQRAVASLKLGATDYVLKDHLDQLAPAVQRALREAEVRRARQQAEAELHWKTAFLEAQVNSALDGILVVNQAGKQILRNQRMIQLWKIPEEIAVEVDDQKQLQFVIQHTKNPEQFLEKITYLYSHPNEISRDEIELTDGTVLDRYSSPVVGKDGTYYGRIWTFRDITQHRRLEEQLRQAQRMEGIGQLAGGVAHDFNNLLAVMSGNAELVLLEPERLSPEARDCLKQIAAAAERAANLTRQLLVFSRKQVMQPQPLILNDVITNLAKMLKRIIGEQVNLQCELSELLPYIQADAGMMEQVLVNLVVNARDAMPQGGCINVLTHSVAIEAGDALTNSEARPGEFVRLSVHDNGAGIDPADLPRIFEPFFTTKGVGKGTGLGLATVYGIVKQHQGWIEVTSQPGAGARFEIFFPTIPAPSPLDAWRSAEPPLRGGTETILLVEDDPAVRMISRRVLESYGYHILEAGSGPEALKVWNAHSGQIALLLTDMVMPEGLTGRDLADQIRVREPQLKTIFMSGYSSELACKNTDFIRRTNSYFLQKPCSSRTLLDTVRRCLDGQ